MRKKRETAEVKAWREILQGAEADLEIERGRLEQAKINVTTRANVFEMQAANVERVQARLAELEGMGRL